MDSTRTDRSAPSARLSRAAPKGRWTRRWISWLAPLLLVGLWGIGACMTATWTPGERTVRAKCGACHLRPRPGQHSRAELSRILDRHRSRAPLTGTQRAQVVDWLARGDRHQQRPGKAPPGR